LGTVQEKKIQQSEVALIHATLKLVLVLNSQSEAFSLGLDSDTKACWDEVTKVWTYRPHSPSTGKVARPLTRRLNAVAFQLMA
jgi:hypothetical protein